MKTSNYIRGRYREYRTQRILEAQGYRTLRAASSQGCFDVVAFLGPVIRCIQVKSGSGRCSKADIVVLQTLADALRGKCSVEIWRYPGVRCVTPDVEVL